jgi:hypothetical protein
VGSTKSLFLLSRGCCYAPGCNEAVVRLHEGRPHVQLLITHVCALDEGGPRFDPAMTDRERCSFSNIVLLCAGHHAEVSADASISAETLWHWKSVREGELSLQLNDLDWATQEKLEKWMDDAVIRTREAFSGALNRLADVDRDTTGLLRQVVDEAMDRPYARKTVDLEQPTEQMWMLLDTAQGVAARMREASSSLEGLTGTVRALERSSENLAYAALTVPTSSPWSWRSFGWGVAALAVVIAVIAFVQTI